MSRFYAYLDALAGVAAIAVIIYCVAVVVML